MVSKDLLKIDLNLLISLQILLEERSVSKAAERLFITQPAMSKTLNRLRETFDDPLFTRGSHGMQPTPRALEIGENLAGVLRDIEHLIASPSTDPAEYHGEISFALSEYIGIWLLPQLMRRVHEDAPGLTIKAITRAEHQLQQLADGDLDLAIHIKHSHYGDDFICQPLKGRRPVLLAREGHPLSDTSPDWEDLLRYPVVRMYIPDMDDLEVFKTRESISRRLTQSQQRGWLETSHLLTALEVLRNTDYLLPAPPFMLDSPAVAYRIKSLPLPLPPDEDYDIEYMLVRHRRTENSTMHNWFWNLVTDMLGDLWGELQELG